MKTKDYDFIYLSENGWSPPEVGVWDECTKTGILIRDIETTIKIINSNIILEGDGHKIFNCDTGIIVHNQEDIAIKNVNFECKFNSIIMNNTHNSQIIRTSTTNSEGGIFLEKCNNNELVDGC